MKSALFPSIITSLEVLPLKLSAMRKKNTEYEMKNYLRITTIKSNALSEIKQHGGNMRQQWDSLTLPPRFEIFIYTLLSKHSAAVQKSNKKI